MSQLKGNPALAELMKTPMEKMPVALRKMAGQAGTVQEATLMDILARSADTEIGRRLGFARIGSAAEFVEKVPVTDYGDYREAVERLKLGEGDILFPGRASVFMMTSGTTGVAKYIPDSAAGAGVKAMVSNLRTVEMVRMLPAIMAPGTRFLAIANGDVYGRTEGGIPIGSASGQAATEGSMTERMLPPPAVLGLSGADGGAVDDLFILYGLAEKRVVGVVCNNLTHFAKLKKKLDADPRRYIAMIREGRLPDALTAAEKASLGATWTARPDRAEELSAILKERGSLGIPAVWPELGAVSCWLSSGVGRCVKELRSLFSEDTLYMEWGYGASEGKFTIPGEPGVSRGYPAVFGYYFEFIPLDGGDPIPLTQTVPGQRYELVVTSYSGLYRYNMHDIVRVDRDALGLPTMDFVCKASEKVTVGGATLYSGDLMDVVGDYEDRTGDLVRFFQAKVAGGSLDLIVEPVDPAMDREAFARAMAGGLKDRGIALGQIDWKAAGYQDSLYGYHLKNGKSVNQTKLPVFVSGS